MARFLNTSKAYAEIEDIIDKAESRVVLISPYIQISESLLGRLKDIDSRNIRIVLVCKGKGMNPRMRAELKQLEHLNNLQLIKLDNLHAKCFYNEQSMVITSLNLYDYSQQNNREMGIFLSLKEDRDVFNDAVKEAEFIIRSASQISSPSILGVAKPSTTSIKVKTTKRISRRKSKGLIESKIINVLNNVFGNNQGHCIRCGKDMPFNKKSPYCHECFTGGFVSKSSKEFHCHKCGGKAKTSWVKPLCESCFS